MELLDHLRRQFTYDDWANREVLAGFKASTHPSARPLQLLAHILSAERLWLQRLRQQSQSLPVWPDFTLDECAAQINKLAKLWREYLSQLSPAGLSETITVAVEKLPFRPKPPNWRDRKCLGKLRTSFVGLPNAKFFSAFSGD